MAQYTSTTVGAEDIVSYFISLLIIIIIIIIIILFVCKVWNWQFWCIFQLIILLFFYIYFRSSIKQFADNCGPKEQGHPSPQQTDPPR